MKGSAATIIVVLVLSLLGWSAFYLLGVPLKSGETVVLVGIVAVIVLVVKWFIGIAVGKKGDKSE